MPWRNRTRMPTRRPRKAATVEKTQAPSIQASGMRNQSNTKPPAVPMAIASTSGCQPSWPMIFFFADLKATSLPLKEGTAP